jgi:phage gpG-like protein
MARIKIDVDSARVRQELRKMELRSKAFQPLFEYARQRLALANAENFTTGGLPVGGWNPRDEAERWPIMRSSGRLFRSLTTLRGNPNEINATNATFGTKLDYAKFHQYGTSEMEPRKIVFEPRGFASDLGKKAAAWVANGISPT